MTNKEKPKIVGHIPGTYELRTRVYDSERISPAILTFSSGGGQEVKIQVNEPKQSKIRKLTPRECWRLMGFSDEDFEKAQQVNSDTQLYKQAGNSIVVNVLMAIFSQMI
jgi:DNA (cytosine-5)-methyltransferase 1